jgi:hypothetical protein
MNESIEEQKVFADHVAEHDRLNFLPGLFGGEMLTVEYAIYSMAERLIEGYKGGYWEFVKLSNGGGYMYPKSDGKLHIEVDGNCYGGDVSPDAAGIIVCIFTFNHLMWSGHDSDAIRNAYDRLMAYAYDHPEATDIFSAID